MLKKCALTALKSSFLLGLLFLVWVGATPQLPSQESPHLLYHRHLKVVMKKALKSAKHSIHLRTFSLTDPDILKLLNQRANEGIKISVITDPKGCKRPRLHPKIDLTHKKVPGLMHQKICIIDDQILFLGTANMTYSSLHIHDNLVLGTYDPPLAHFIQNPKGNSFQNRFFLLPNKEALTPLIEQLNSAKASIDVAMFCFTHPKLAQALIEAHQRGVRVRVGIDTQTGKGAGKKVFEMLQYAGIDVAYSSSYALFHHKWALIDDQILILGSANWTKSAFNKNKDFFIISEIRQNKTIRAIALN